MSIQKIGAAVLLAWLAVPAAPALAQSKYVPLPPRGEAETASPSSRSHGDGEPPRAAYDYNGGDDQQDSAATWTQGDDDSTPFWTPAPRGQRPFPPPDRGDDDDE